MQVRISRSVAFALAALVATACSDQLTDPTPAPGIQLLIVSGDNQVAPAGQELPQPIVVKATNGSNQPIPNVVVNFVVTAGGGSVFAGAALTDANGLAADVWRLGPNPGTPQSLEVRSVDAQGNKFVWGTFTAMTAPNPAASIQKVQGDGQTTQTGTAVAVAPAVKLLDQNGDPVAGASVAFAVASGGGSITGGSAVTDGQGVATVGSWTLGSTPGPNTLTATAADLPGSPVTFTATGTGAGSMSLVTPPSSSAQNGAALAVQPVVQLLDGQGAPLAQSGVTVTATVVEPGATASNATATTDDNGRATFAGLTITGTVGAYTLQFDVAGLSPLTSAPINLAAGPASLVEISGGDGQSASAGTLLPIAPSVVVLDQSGNPVANVTVTFAVVLGGGSVTGASAVTNVNGTATVGGWTLGLVPGMNGLTATATGVATPAAFSATGLGNIWNDVSANMPTPRRYVASGVLNNLLYVAGGRNSGGSAVKTMQAYNPATNSWSTKANMISVRVGAFSGVLNGLLYVAGGTSGSGSGTIGLSTVESYNPATNTWTARGSLPGTRSFGASAVVNGMLYVIGGDSNGSGVLSTVYAYNPVTDSWTQKASLPAPRNNSAAVVVNGLIYVVGGSPVMGPADGAVLVYDPVFDSWSTRTPMSTPRYHLDAVEGNGLIYAISGYEPGTSVASAVMEAYDPTTDTWIGRASMQQTRLGAGLGFINGLIYSSGGSYNGSAVVATTERYVP